MGALPKNKITRAERGKRRQGNTPSLKRDVNHTTVPLHKRGMVAEFMQLMGIASGKQTTTKKSAAKKKTSKKAAPTKVSKAPVEKPAPQKAQKKSTKKTTSRKQQGK